MTRIAHRDHRGTRGERQVVRVSAPRGTGVFVLRGVIGDELLGELRETLHGAIDEGLVAIVLDLGDVDSISSSAREVIVSAGWTLAGHGGRLLAWIPQDGVEDAYLMRELRYGSDFRRETGIDEPGWP